MFTRLVRVGVVAVAAAAVGMSTAGVAGAWPTIITPEMQQYIDNARGAGATGDDDALLSQGYLACRLLYTGQGVAAAEAATSPAVVGAARGTLCTQAPG
ncbi:hypothetical protein [Mycobacterium sp. 1274756.6]|uniref:hypothetical protein n=1 Tax=Mycobacterium sp. 1274756.6 TaxID=1834076 RepID=UPI0007FC7D06|nr:hypothetical protein [Mycobacterium sp. 1274756.6]OBJ74063.1 hypothetical protein A5643_02340 [Mycobacterium sp. 1274756.6]